MDESLIYVWYSTGYASLPQNQMIHCFIECLWAQYQNDSQSALQIITEAQAVGKNLRGSATNPTKMNILGDDPDSESDSESEDEAWEWGEDEGNDGDGDNDEYDIHMLTDSEYEFDDHDDHENMDGA